MEEHFLPTGREDREDPAILYSPARRLGALQEQVRFAQHVSEYIEDNQEQVLRNFHEGFRKRLKPLELLLGVEGVAEILSSLADINELRPQLYPVYRDTMEEAAVKDIRKVFGKERGDLFRKNTVSRLVTAWEYWKRQHGKPASSFREFLELRKAEIRDHTGTWEIEDIIDDTPTTPYNEEYTAKGYERAGRDVLENIVDATGFVGLIALAQSGRLPTDDEDKLKTFKELYIKKLPENQRESFTKIWDELTSPESMRWYGRERLAYLLSVNSADLVATGERTLTLIQRGQKRQATITVGADGRYAVRSGAETRAFSDQQMQEMVHFLHRASA